MFSCFLFLKIVSWSWWMTELLLQWLRTILLTVWWLRSRDDISLEITNNLPILKLLWVSISSSVPGVFSIIWNPELFPVSHKLFHSYFIFLYIFNLALVTRHIQLPLLTQVLLTSPIVLLTWLPFICFSTDYRWYVSPTALFCFLSTLITTLLFISCTPSMFPVWLPTGPLISCSTSNIRQVAACHGQVIVPYDSFLYKKRFDLFFRFLYVSCKQMFSLKVHLLGDESCVWKHYYG